MKKEINIDASKINLYKSRCKDDIIFVSNPQLKTKETKEIATEVLKNAIGLMTGTVEEGTLSHQLIQDGKMLMCRYPVHLNYSQFVGLTQKNQFEKVIAYHTPQIDCENELDF